MESVLAKIVILTTVHGKKDTRIFFKEILSLKKKYSEISFVVPDENNEIFFESGIKIIPLPIPRSKQERLIDNQKKAWKIVKDENPDIVHFHDPELILFGYILKKRLKIKVIFDIHENVSASFKDNLWIPSFLKPAITPLYKVIEKLLIKRFDALIIAESSYRKTYGKKPVEILNYPILPEKIIEEKSFNEPFNLVYVGGIWERRGAFKMLELFQQLLNKGFNVNLFLVGPFVPQSLEEKIKELINKNNLNERVKIYGKLPLKDVYSVLEKSHLGLSLMKDIGNYRESLSTKIFEYMAHSIPFVVSDFPIYEKYAVKEKTGLTVDYENDIEIFEKVSSLLQNPAEMKRMGIAGLEAVRTKWNWENEEKKLLRLYEELLG